MSKTYSKKSDLVLICTFLEDRAHMFRNRRTGEDFLFQILTKEKQCVVFAIRKKSEMNGMHVVGVKFSHRNFLIVFMCVCVGWVVCEFLLATSHSLLCQFYPDQEEDYRRFSDIMGSGPSINSVPDTNNSFSGDEDVDEVDSRMEGSESEDEVLLKGQQLSMWVIRKLALEESAPRAQRDEVLLTLCSCVCDILEKHKILFNGMVTRIEIKEYREFASVANELFEANSNNESCQLRITWGRVIALFAFAVRLSQEYKLNQNRVNHITRFLALYIAKHVLPFVRENGGWNGLVEQFPGTEGEDGQFRRAILWSGLCVGIAATMYITSLLR